MTTTIKNTSGRRIWHRWQHWECYQSGFFTPATSADQLRRWRSQYVELLSDIPRFERAMERVMAEWPFSCAQNLTNESMNRIAWLGQASCCIEFGACAEQTRSAFNLLPKAKRRAANRAAAKKLAEWLRFRTLFEGIDR